MESGHRVVGSRYRGLLLDRLGLGAAVELDDALAFGVFDDIGEYGGANAPVDLAGEQIGKSLAVKDVVSEHERDRIAAHELAADD